MLFSYFHYAFLIFHYAFLIFHYAFLIFHYAFLILKFANTLFYWACEGSKIFKIYKTFKIYIKQQQEKKTLLLLLSGILKMILNLKMA